MTTLRESDKPNHLKNMFSDRSNKICKDKCPGATRAITTIRDTKGNDFENFTQHFMTRLELIELFQYYINSNFN